MNRARLPQERAAWVF